MNDTGRRGRILIVGAGFSGMSAAIMLRRAGYDVEIVERSAEWTADGAGISMGAASLRALDTLGVLDRFFELGCGVDGTEVRTPDGTKIAEFPTQRLVSPELPGNGAIMRPVLADILVGEMLEVGVHPRLGTTVTHFEDNGDRVTATFSDGGSGEYDLVVAADGLYSDFRRRLFPSAPAPAFSGQGAWRAVVSRPAAMSRTTLWVGAADKVGVNPISNDKMYLFVNENRLRDERVTETELISRLRGFLEPISDPVMAEIRASIGEDSLVLYRPMHNLLLPLPWHRGRVVLIGDAAHSTTPHLAAGAGIGIEDAIVLAEELSATSAIELALDQFGQRRWERCRMVVESSERLGELERDPAGQQEFTRLQAESFRALASPI
jgi:2-polyprenyl-6-methoxyphenol hydroxylase-like FAD-dependent oxidoreductase